ncbi:MAG: protein kinase [Planctomycetes bacterium]|nr:protein kinase [Planctomycetota bacterium]
MAEEPVTARFGRWRLVEETARGGWGAVHRAEDAAGDPTAIKILAPRDPADLPEGRERFRREEDLLRRYPHPHLVRLLDAGETEGTPFLVLEWLPGPDLLSRVAGAGPLTLDDALRVGRDAAAVLAHLHEGGVVHRDLKPSNFSFDASAALKLLDLGLAADPAALKTLTARGTFIGTVGFAAPEVAAGETAGPESDIYGLGVVLYWCLTGRPPFTGRTERTVLRRQARDPILPPSELRPRIPSEFNALICAMLEINPTRRPDGMRRVESRLAKITPNQISGPSRPRAGRGARPATPSPAAWPGATNPHAREGARAPDGTPAPGPDDPLPPQSQTIIRKGFRRRPAEPAP